MDKYDTLMKNLKEGIPFGLARFNDGEMMGIGTPGCVVARGDQVVPPDLSDALREALEYEQENYWKGLPCSLCFPQHSALAKNYVNEEYDYLTHAVVFTNRHWMKFLKDFSQSVIGRTMYWVGGEDQDTSKLPHHGFSYEIDAQFIVPSQDGWSAYADVKDLYEEFEAGAIVLVACGPLARVLTQQWFKNRPDLTIIDIGSTFAPFTRNVWHNCHKGWEETGFNLTAKCQECN